MPLIKGRYTILFCIAPLHKDIFTEQYLLCNGATCFMLHIPLCTWNVSLQVIENNVNIPYKCSILSVPSA